MSASLVGSEMCIRDRTRRAWARGCRAGVAPGILASLSLRPPQAVGLGGRSLGLVEEVGRAPPKKAKFS
eukprot:11009039-Alexandrium_andersonii.AAC.1